MDPNNRGKSFVVVQPQNLIELSGDKAGNVAVALEFEFEGDWPPIGREVGKDPSAIGRMRIELIGNGSLPIGGFGIS